MESTVERKPAAALRNDDRRGRHLVFELGREEFAIRVLTSQDLHALNALMQ